GVTPGVLTPAKAPAVMRLHGRGRIVTVIIPVVAVAASERGIRRLASLPATMKVASDRKQALMRFVELIGIVTTMGHGLSSIAAQSVDHADHPAGIGRCIPGVPALPSAGSELRHTRSCFLRARV